MAALPQTDVRARLLAAGVGSPALVAADVYLGIEVPSSTQEGAGTVPDRAVFCRELAGTEPNRHHDGTSYRQAIVLVSVRSAKDAYAAGVLLAEAVWGALEKSTLSADYVLTGCEATQSSFAYGGTDEVGRHRWHCAFRCIFVA